MSWVFLISAGLLEMVWAVGMKYTQGFTKIGPSVFTPALHTISGGAVRAHREPPIAGRARGSAAAAAFDLGLGDRRFSAASAARSTCSRARVPTGSAARRGLLAVLRSPRCGSRRQFAWCE
ncbi:MAG: hypothetical protein GXY58_11240 [Planctomycetaceae bacterium]|nr:hypothetical protein [Planctomycetaceae bacterium]